MVFRREEESEPEALMELQEQWKDMFQGKLPNAATSKSSSQKSWPVHVDHCFARIILDNIIGEGKEPWIGKIKTPAYKNMSREQLIRAIELGNQILRGDVDLVALDESSLASRGKAGKGKGQDRGKKLIKESGTASPYFTTTHDPKRKRDDDDSQSLLGQDTPPLKKDKREDPCNQEEGPRPMAAEQDTPATDISHLIRKIESSNKTPFQKRVLMLLCQIPSGSYTTYGAMARHMKSSARAVGNALKNNPFAPQVPCHRVLATGGGLGGFGGSWGRNGEEGKNDKEKRRLLREEGVMFDGKGKVVGRVWEGFH